MTISLPLERLRSALEERGEGAYVLTVSDDGRPHAVYVPVRWQGGRLAADVGKRTAANAASRSRVSLLYPVRAADDYTLIVDGDAVAESEGDVHRLLITPSKAVMHRAAAAPDPTSACGSDCVPLLAGEATPSERTR